MNDYFTPDHCVMPALSRHRRFDCMNQVMEPDKPAKTDTVAAPGRIADILRTV